MYQLMCVVRYVMKLTNTKNDVNRSGSIAVDVCNNVNIENDVNMSGGVFGHPLIDSCICQRLLVVNGRVGGVGKIDL